MSRKYIKQIINQDFVYPNNEVSEYDIELVQDLNSNSVSGTVINFSAPIVQTTGITLTYNYTWSLNNAEPWVRNSGVNGILSVHCIVPGQTHYKPWRTVSSVAASLPVVSTRSGSGTFTILPSNFGLTSFTNGTYYFEFRFIGHLSIYPVCANLNLIMGTPSTTATPTPTPTPTPSTSVTPTPTPTPTPTTTPTPTPTPTGGAKSLQIYGRDIDGSPSTLTLFYNINGGGNINVPGYTGTILPSSCTLLYTITGLTALDSVVIGTSIGCVMDGTIGINSCPSVTSSSSTYTYVIDAPTTQSISISIDSGIIP